MEINRNNYEMIFLEQNPDIKEEFDSFDNISISPELNIQFENKEILKKNVIINVSAINSENYKDYFVADLEDDLSDKETIQLKIFLKKNSYLINEYNLFKKTFLKPDINIIYDDKQSLKKLQIYTPYKKYLYYAASIAATVLLFISLYYFNRNKSVNNEIVRQINITTPIIKAPAKVIIPDEFAKPNIIKFRHNYKSINNFGFDNDNSIQYAVKQRESIKISTPEKITTKNKLAIKTKEITDIFISNRNYYSNVFDDIKMIEENDYSISYKEAGKDKKSFIGMVFSGVKNIFIKTDNLAEQNVSEKQSFWAFAINGYNRLTDNDVILERKYDEDGNIIAYNLTGSKFEMSRNKSKDLP